MTMGDRIKTLRLEHNMTQEQLGNVIGVQKSAIRKYESGHVENIKRSSIKKLAQVFGVSPSYLMFGEDPSLMPVSELFQNDGSSRTAQLARIADLLPQLPDDALDDFEAMLTARVNKQKKKNDASTQKK
ncbi:MAG: helix-turn-helix domain-containing protein [Clostridia bacterium]|nr:helix-turn-helix domain-containing protein [Clostridia bacterium]